MTGPRVEQLHYTWAQRGVEGVNRFQIAAISPGLTKAPLAALVPVLRRICQYDRGPAVRPASSASAVEQHDPISFGWFDHRDVRVAFCRTSLPPLRGKVGNFAAHILVGPPAAMPEGELAQLFESPMWWIAAPAGEAQPTVSSDHLLQPLELADWTHSNSAEETGTVEAAEALAGALLRLKPKVRLTISGDSWRFGRVLRTIGKICPEALAGISLSTFETTPPFPFRVLGSPISRAGYESFALDEKHSIDAEFHETFTRLSHGAAEGELLARAVAAAVADLAGDERREAYRLTAQRISDGANGRLDQTALSQIAPLPGAIEYIASAERGREAIAESLIAGDDRICVALRQAQPPVAPRDLSDIFGLVAAKYGDDRSLRGCGPTISLLSDLVGSAEGDQSVTILRTALEESRAETLASGDVAVLLAVAAQQPLDVAELAPLIREAAARPDLFLRDERLPPDYQLAIFRSALVEKPLRLDALARFVREHAPDLTRAELTDAETERLVDVLETLTRDDLAHALAECLAIVGRAAPVDRVVALLTRVDSRDAIGALVASARRSREDSLFGLARRFAAELLAGDFRAGVEVAGPVGLARANQLLRQIDDPECRGAVSVLSALGGEKRVPEILQAVATVGAISDPELQPALEKYARAVAVRSVLNRADAADVWESLFRTRFDTTDALSQMLLAAASSPSAASHVLGWLAADLLRLYPEYVRRGGFLRDGDGAVIVAELAQRADTRALLQYEDEVASAIRPVRRWWRHVTSIGAHRQGLRGRVSFRGSRTNTDGEVATAGSPTMQPDEGAGT